MPFLFLDRYNKELARTSSFWKDFFHELRDLHKISRGEVFRKNVALELGADVTISITQHIASKMQSGFNTAASVMPVAGGALFSSVGLITTMGASEIANRVILFAKYTGRCVLYNFAFKELHGEERVVNEYIYSLGD